MARRKGAQLREMLAASGRRARATSPSAEAGAKVEASLAAVRGRGLMLAVQVADPLHAMATLQREGVIALPCGEGSDFALALVPPLTIEAPGATGWGPFVGYMREHVRFGA